MTDSQSKSAACSPSASSTGSETWWKTRGAHDWTVAPVEVSRATENSVWAWDAYRKKHERRRRRSTYDDYWPTREEAVAHLIARAEHKKAAAERTIAEMTRHITDLSPNG